MPRKLTATTGVVLALALGSAGCGGDDKKADSPAQNAATPPAAATTTTGTATGSKKGGKSSKTPTATSDALPSATKKTGTSKSSSKTKTTGKQSTSTTATKPKVTAKKKTPVPAVTPKSTGSGSGSDLSSGTGSGPGAERLDVVGTLRRYYKAFIDRDAAAVCDLLTESGQKIMTQDGNGKNCEDSAKKLMDKLSDTNVTLLQRTRDGLHIDDIKVSGDNAVAQIGKTSTLKLVQQNGRWLVRSPNVEVSNS